MVGAQLSHKFLLGSSKSSQQLSGELFVDWWILVFVDVAIDIVIKLNPSFRNLPLLALVPPPPTLPLLQFEHSLRIPFHVRYYCRFSCFRRVEFDHTI